MVMYSKALLFQGIKSEIKRKEEKRENEIFKTKEKVKKMTRQKSIFAIIINSLMQYE